MNKKISMWKYMKQAWGAGLYFLMFILGVMLGGSIYDYTKDESNLVEVFIMSGLIGSIFTICFVYYYVEVIRRK